MNEIPSGNPFEFQIRRHPDRKQGESVENREGEPLPISLQGIIEAQSEGKKLADQIASSPRGTIYRGFTSNAPRTREADYIFSEELRYAAKNLPNSKIYTLGSEQSPTIEMIASEVDEYVDKVVIINSPEHSALGIYDWNMGALNEEIQERGETNFLRLWLVDRGLQEKVGVTPQEIGIKFKEWIKEQIETTRALFPGRPMVITGIGHGIELDAAIAVLMGKDLSGDVLGDLGGQIETMEEARIVIDKEGKGTIHYRDIQADLNIE